MVMARSFNVKKVRKQMYPATYNFRDEVDGTTGTDINFVDFDGSGADCIVSIVSSWQSHRKVLKCADANAATLIDVYNSFSAQPYGTIEFFVGTTDASRRFNVYFQTVGTIVFGMRIEADQFQYYDGGWVNIGVVPSDNALYHIRIDFECTTGGYQGLAQYDWHIYINGTHYGDYDFASNEASLNRLRLFGNNAAANYDVYFDAFGYSWDISYKIGDNCFWRHYKETSDDFESEDVGTQGLSIGWVDSEATADDTEIVQEFNNHKKIIRTYRNSGAGNYQHEFDSVGLNGWVELWVKVADANAQNIFMTLREVNNIRVYVIIDNDRFEYSAGAGFVDTGAVAVDNTWYHLFVQWYSDRTFDLWVDNVQYLDGATSHAAFTGIGISRWSIDQLDAGAKYIYFDAPISSLDGDTRADNRTFDYNDSYTREDITTLVKNVIYKNEIYKWREASLKSETSYENSEVFFQICDINNKLAMEADIKNRNQISKEYIYSLRDKNQDGLENRSSNTFTTNKIHDPTDSTSMLKIILPNISEADGDLILVDADTKTDTYSPVTKNYPDYLMLRDIADLADSVIIIQADGKVYMDDDKVSGTALDFDTEADKDKMTAAPLVTDILENINYFEIFGAINPDTGTRFYKIIDNVGDDKKKSWRYTNNEFRNQTDVDNYATALKNRTAAIKNVKFTAQSLGVHNMGETLNYKYVDALYNIPQANYYIIFESIDFDLNENTIILSEGMIESSKYAAVYERPENYNDSFAAEIYETDIIITDLNLIPESGASEDGNGIQTIKTQLAVSHFYLPSNIDEDRDLIIDFVFKNHTHGARTTDGALFIRKYAADGSADGTTIENYSSFDPIFTVNSGYYHLSHTVSASDLTADNHYLIQWRNDETDNGNATICWVSTVQIKYYQKRSL